MTRTYEPSAEQIARMLIEAHALELRDVPMMVTNAEVDRLPTQRQPFLYSSGNWGPGYVSIKNLVGRKDIIKYLCHHLALRVADEVRSLGFIAGNVTGGMVPGWQLSEELEGMLGRRVPFVYIRGTRKKGGQKELITGITDNPEISPGANGLVVEELVNFAESTCAGAVALRDAGYQATHGACILFYGNPEAIKTLGRHRVGMVYLLTLPRLLAVARWHRAFPGDAIADYECFLTNPLEWQGRRGLKPVRENDTQPTVAKH